MKSTLIYCFALKCSFKCLHSTIVKDERWGAGMVICLERGADLHMT